MATTKAINILESKGFALVSILSALSHDPIQAARQARPHLEALRVLKGAIEHLEATKAEEVAA